MNIIHRKLNTQQNYRARRGSQIHKRDWADPQLPSHHKRRGKREGGRGNLYVMTVKFPTDIL